MTTKFRIGVVGAGTMGRGIVQLFAQSGHEIWLFDSVDDAASRAITAVHAMIDKGVGKRQFTPDQGEAIKRSIKPCRALEDFVGCDLVIEAIVEDLGAKQALFAALESIVAPSAILASNTSSLIVAEIGAKCRHPERVAGLHFFNPVPLMKVVEIVQAVRTATRVIEILRNLVFDAGHRAVIVADQPGFLVNHAGRGLYTEGLRILEENVADPAQVDVLMREAAGFRMGPFELMDLTGLDVSGKVMASIYEQFQHEPRLRPSSLVPPRIAAGLFGRKSKGCGWYRYDEQGRAEAGAACEAGPVPAGLTVWIDPAAEQYVELTRQLLEKRVALLAEPDHADLCLIQPWGTDASSACAEQGLDPQRTVALDPLPGLARHRSLMLTIATRPEVRDVASSLLRADGALTVINDSPGFVVQRILATIVNIAADIAQRRIAGVADLEDAVRLGLGYPRGPLSLGDSIGGERILRILRNVQAATGDPRYRPSPWLVRRVALKQPLTMPEAERRASGEVS